MSADPKADGGPVDDGFDFDTVHDRRGSDSVKWAGDDNDVLPAWVADMDFPAPAPIVAALRRRLDAPWLGYADPPNELTEAICARMSSRFGWAISPDWLVHVPGVVNAFSFFCRFAPGGALAAAKGGADPGSIAVVAPVYPPLLTAPQMAGRRGAVVALAESRDHTTLRYELDLDALRDAFRAGARQLLWCAPQNPTGVVFTRRELESLAELCLRHGVTVCSDDIWAELTLGGIDHLPLASISPEIAARTITLIAPSKTFNVPAMGYATAIIPDADTRETWHSYEGRGYALPNVVGFYGASAAYRHCDRWLDALRAYLTANRDFVVDYVAAHLPGAAVTRPDATYLAWIDLSAYRDRFAGAAAVDFLVEHARVRLSGGADFGGRDDHVRLNFGCPRRLLAELLERIRDALEPGGSSA